MFFIYKKKSTTLLRGNKLLIDRIQTSKQPRVLIVTFDTAVLRSMVLPIKFILKETNSFLLLYRFQSIRNYNMLAEDIQDNLKGRGIHSVLLPTKGIRHVLRIFVLFRLPFHFIRGGVGGKLVSKLESYVAIRILYTSLWANVIYSRLQSIT